MTKIRKTNKIMESYRIDTIKESCKSILKMVKSLELTGKYPIDNGFWSISNRWNSIIQERAEIIKNRHNKFLLANKPFRKITNLWKEIVKIRKIKPKWRSLWLLNQVYDLFSKYYNYNALFVNLDILDEIHTILLLFKEINIYVSDLEGIEKHN